jgi:hypothetical protein
MNTIPMDHLFGPAGSSSSIPALSLIAAVAVIIIAIIAVIVWVMSLRSRLLAFSGNVDRCEKTVSNLSAELEAQALLARQMSMDLEEMRKRLLSHEEAGQADSPVWSFASGPLNLNRRGQILRLSRKGKSVAEIAQDLNVAQGEVELLLKVHDLSQKTPRQEN